jgi:predicted DNA-binding protein YlxM (UPF0122 family)
MMNNSLPNEEWKKNFRLSRTQFFKLLDEQRPYITPKPNSPNYRSLPAQKKLAMTLYYLKDTGSLRMTANSFGIHVSTASKTIHQVCKAITQFLGQKYLKLQKTQSEIQEKISEFEVMFGMSQAFGCIDGTHVPILRPVDNSQDYFCYKMFFSLNVQAVCDSRGRFMDVDCRWPGSVHDAKVFANCSVNKKLQNGVLPVTYQLLVPGHTKVECYLIVDPAYPLTPYCMKEYGSCSTNAQVVFNNMLRSARNPIECAFGRLKARWGFLTRKVDLKLDLVPTAVYACFVLHNFCEQHMYYVDSQVVQNQQLLQQCNQHEARNIPDPVFSGNLDEGSVTRDIVTFYIENNLPDHLVEQYVECRTDNVQQNKYSIKKSSI